MQKLYDTLVGLCMMGYILMGDWTGPVWQMAVILFALLAVMAWAGWMGGCIEGTEKHRNRNRKAGNHGRKRRPARGTGNCGKD